MRLLAFALLIATPAFAQDWQIDFRSPSDNLHCSIYTFEGQPQVRCDRVQFTDAPPRPDDCDLDWGHAFWVGATGKGQGACAGDTIISRTSPVLDYGRSVELDGVRCLSEQTGMICKNREGGGFSIARSRANLF